MIEVERADEIELNNGVVIMVKTSDYLRYPRSDDCGLHP
jgi:hypothetical protein